MASACFKRLRKEIQALSAHPDPDLFLQASEEDIRQWFGRINGPQDSPYHGGIFYLKIVVGSQYPLVPPAITFVTKIFHPNVAFDSGEICLDILKREWSPAWNLQGALRAIVALLLDPAADSPLNCDAGNMIRGGDMRAFRSMARMYTIEHAAPSAAAATQR